MIFQCIYFIQVQFCGRKIYVTNYMEQSSLQCLYVTRIRSTSCLCLILKRLEHSISLVVGSLSSIVSPEREFAEQQKLPQHNDMNLPNFPQSFQANRSVGFLRLQPSIKVCFPLFNVSLFIKVGTPRQLNKEMALFSVVLQNFSQQFRTHTLHFSSLRSHCASYTS